jgi:hypothetical protein
MRGTGDMIRKTIATAVAATMAITAVQAQQVGPFAPVTTQVDARATIGITVPLGGRRGDIASRPRAELRLEQGSEALPIRSRTTLRAVGIRGGDSIAPTPGALAVTLSGNPRWIAGGRVLGADQDETPEDDDGIDTLEGVGIGVGVILGLGAAAVGILVLSLECDADEECN